MGISHKIDQLKNLQESTPLRLSPTQLKLMDKDDLKCVYEENSSLLVAPTNNIYISLDNTLVKSCCELLFSNFLYMNKIEYQYDQVIDSDTLFRYDFKINNVFIEFFCFYGKKYEERVKDKKEYYLEKKMTLKYFDYTFFKDVKYHILYNKFIKLLQDIGYQNHVFMEFNLELFISGHQDYLKYLKSILNNYIIQNNTIPNSKEFREMNLCSLERIVRHYGGSKIVCKLLNLDDSKFRNSWENQSYDDLVKKYLEICTTLNRIPYDSDFQKLKLTGFLSFLRNSKLKEEFEQIAIENNFKTYHQLKYDGNNPIQTLEELTDFLLPLCRELRHIPTRTELEKINLTFVNTAISNLTSRDELSFKLGFPTFNDMNNIRTHYTEDELITELGYFVNELGYLPTQSDLQKYNSYSIIYYIRKYGGYDEIAKKMNVPTAREAKDWENLGFWNSPANLLTLIYNSLLPLALDLGYIPNEKYLRKNNLYNLTQLINKMGGRKNLSEMLNIPTYNKYHKRAEINHWDKEGKRLKEALFPFCNELGYIPSSDYLQKINRNDLIHAIRIFEGDLQELMGFPKASVAKEIAPKGSNYDIKYLEVKIKPLIEKHGHFPTPKQLEENNLQKLEKSIIKHGNRPNLAEHFNTLTFTEYRKLKKAK